MKLSIFVVVVAFGIAGAILFVPSADLRTVALVCTVFSLAVTGRIHSAAGRYRSMPLSDAGEACAQSLGSALVPGTHTIRRWEDGLALFDDGGFHSYSA